MKRSDQPLVTSPARAAVLAGETHVRATPAPCPRSPVRRALRSWIAGALVTLCMAPFALPHANHRNTSSFQDSAQLASIIDAHVTGHVDWQEVACTPEGEWVIVPVDSPPLYSRGFPSAPRRYIDYLYNVGQEVQAIAFTARGSWTVIGENEFWYSDGIPQAELFHQHVLDFWARYGGVGDVAFTGRGFALISKTGAFVAYNVPSDLWDALLDTYSSGRKLNHVEVDAEGRWLVTADQWFASDAVTKQMFKSFKYFQRSELRLDHHMIGPGNSFVLFSHGVYQPDFNDPIEKFEYDFANGKNIWVRMDELNIPGTSLAVVENNKVIHTRGYGLIEGKTQRFVRTSTPFYQGSNAKFLTALSLVKMVDDGQLELNTNLEELMIQKPKGELAKWRNMAENFYSIFTGWLGYPAYSIPLPTMGITVERLLSHTAGIKTGGGMPPSDGLPFYGAHYQLLGHDGAKYDPDTFAWLEQGMVPGGQYHYSGAGYYISELIAEQASNAEFADHMSQRLFLPLGMTESVAQRKPDAHWDGLCSKFHTAKGKPRPTRMETRYVSAGGMYVSPRDYAKALLVVLKKGLHPDSDVQRFLSEDNANEILTRRPNSTTYGLGVGTWGEHFQHNGALGSNYYTSGARFIADRSKQKAVIFASNQNGSSGPDWFVENALLGEGIDAYRRAFNF